MTPEIPKTSVARARLALLFSAPIPLLGVLFGASKELGLSGQAIWAFLKIWTFLFPAFWLKAIEHKKFSVSPMRYGGIWTGLASGLIFGGIALGLIVWLRDWFISAEDLRAAMTDVGLDSKKVYIGGMIYWIAVNSLLEEYFWRWFVFDNLNRALGGAKTGIAALGSAILFSVHHLVACLLFLEPIQAIVATLGVFLAGWLWSILYLRFKSVWPAYISHAIVDIPIFGIGYWLMFGGGSVQ